MDDKLIAKTAKFTSLENLYVYSRLAYQTRSPDEKHLLDDPDHHCKLMLFLLTNTGILKQGMLSNITNSMMTTNLQRAITTPKDVVTKIINYRTTPNC